MKKVIIILILLALAGGIYYYVSRHCEEAQSGRSDRGLYARGSAEPSGFCQSIVGLFNSLRSRAMALLKKEAPPAEEERTEEIKPQEEEEPEEIISANSVTLHLKNKSVISGELIREMPDKIYIQWMDGEVGFKRDEIERIEYGKKVKEKKGLLFADERFEWPHEQDIVVQLTNLEILDAEITGVSPDKIILHYPIEGGGSIEQEIERSKVETLLFKPLRNEESIAIEDSLREQFPKMRFYYEGLFAVVTDSTNIWADKYKKVLRSHLTDFYFTYFELLKDREPKIEHYVVIFDSWNDYFEYAITDGAWGARGYFMPTDEVLYLYNSLGEEADEYLHKVLLSRVRDRVGEIEDYVKQHYDKRYHIFIEGMADEIKSKYVRYYNRIKSMFREDTYNTLRHEFTHELFHNWGLQMIVVSESGLSKEEITEKKKEYLETTDEVKKGEILLGIYKLKAAEYESFEEEAGNSWFVEGAATYSGTDPIGAKDEFWLYMFQEAKRNNMLLPIEQLTVYKIGSFPGVAPKAQLYAYGQSWAFTHFLMHNYHSQFINYLERIATEKPEEQEDILWLLEALNKELRPLENEFLKYMDQFEEAEMPDFQAKIIEIIYEIWY